MDTRTTPSVTDKEKEKVFRVKGSTASTDLASAIAHAVGAGHEVVLKAVGAGAINQAVKALPIAKSFVASFGTQLLFDANFFHGTAPEGEILGVAITVLRR